MSVCKLARGALSLNRRVASCAPTWVCVGAYDLLGVEYDPFAT